MKIKDIIQVIEDAAPLALQEKYDNSGVQVGNTSCDCTGVLLCIDITEEVIHEAIQLQCNLIVAHHPICFHPIKKLTGKSYIERCIIQACKHDIVLYAAHTNLDNASYGINHYLAEQLQLQNTQILSPIKDNLLKLVTFAPSSYAETIRQALFHAGAGNIGNYECTSYNSIGTGTFMPNSQATPFCGHVGQLHSEEETRIETILPRYKKETVIHALKATHPYEEPAFDLIPLENIHTQVGSGIVGTLPESLEKEEFLYLIKNLFQVETLQYSHTQQDKIKEVAICSGSGAFLLPEASRYGADVLITGEAKYNHFLDAESNIMLVTVGHYESEICSKEIFFTLISKKYPNFAVYKSRTDINPVHYL